MDFSHMELEWFEKGDSCGDNEQGSEIAAVRKTRGYISNSIRTIVTLVLASFVAESCAPKGLRDVNYGDYFQDIEPPKIEKYSSNENFKTFVDYAIQLFFDKNLSLEEKEDLKQKFAKLKAETPFIPYATDHCECISNYNYKRYDCDWSWTSGDERECKFDEGEGYTMFADTFLRTTEAGHNDYETAMSDFENALDDVKDAREQLDSDASAEDYENYYAALKTAGDKLESMLNIFPLANAYILADVLIMCSKYGVKYDDLKKYSGDCCKIPHGLSSDQSADFRQYLLESFKRAVKENRDSTDFLKNLESLLIGMSIVPAEDPLFTELDKMTQSQDAATGGKKDSAEESDLKKIDRMGKEVETKWNILAPKVDKLLKQAETVKDTDDVGFFNLARETVKFFNSAEFKDYSKSDEAFADFLKSRPDLWEKTAPPSELLIGSLGKLMECILLRARIQTQLWGAIGSEYESCSEDSLFGEFNNVHYFLEHLFDKFKLLKQGQYNSDEFLVDFVEVLSRFMPMAKAVARIMQDEEKLSRLSQYNLITLEKARLDVAFFGEIVKYMQTKMRAPVSSDISSPGVISYNDFDNFQTEVLNETGIYLVEVMSNHCPPCAISDISVNSYAKAGTDSTTKKAKISRLNLDHIKDSKLLNWIQKTIFGGSDQVATPAYIMMRNGKQIGDVKIGAFRSVKEVEGFVNKAIGTSI